MYRLASEFYLPPSSLDVWSGAMMLFKRALSIATDPTNKNDAAFNLAETFNATADVLEEYQGERARAQAMELREHATKLLNPVIQTQFMFVMHQQEEKDAEAASEAATAVRAAEDESKKVEEEGMEVDGADKAETSGGDDEMKVDDAEDKAEEEEVEPTVASMPTPDTLVDTVLLTADIGITLWNYFNPPQLPPDSQQEAIQGIINTARTFAPANRQAELDLMDSKALLQVDANMWDMVKDQITPGTPMDSTLEKAAGALERILTSLDAAPGTDSSTRADILSTLADTEMNAAARLMLLSARTQDKAPLGTRAWALLSAAAKHLTQAAGLPVGEMPKEFRPNVYLGLLRATLARARLAPINGTAASNAQKLLDNCAAYAAKAADAAGWTLPKLPRANDPQPNPFFAEPLTPPFPAGWDMEMLARDIQLHMLRVCFFVSTGMFDAAGVDRHSYEAAGKAVVEGITSIKYGTRRLMPRDLDRFVSDIEEDEGKISTEEDNFWKEVGQQIRAGVPPEEHREDAPQEFAPAVAEAIRTSGASGPVQVDADAPAAAPPS